MYDANKRLNLIANKRLKLRRAGEEFSGGLMVRAPSFSETPNDVGLIPGGGTKIPNVPGLAKKKKKKKNQLKNKGGGK